MSLEGPPPDRPPEEIPVTEASRPPDVVATDHPDPIGSPARLDGIARAVRGHPQLTRLAALGVACVLVGVTVFVVGDGLRPTGPTGSPLPASPSLGAGPAASGSPAPGTTVGPTPAPTPTEGPWADLELAPLEPLATLVASDVDRTGVGRSSRFTLTSLTDVPATTLAKGVSAVPAVDFTVKKGSNSRTAVLVPKAPLSAGVSYRVTLRTSDGALGGSWLFRAESPLRVASTLPGDHATEVPVDTGIEVTFDQDGVGPIAPFFSISPAVKGDLERHGRTWAFVPATPLKPATIYTVTVRKGVTLTGSDQVLEEDRRFAFETASTEPTPERPPLDASFPRPILEVVPADPPLVELAVDQPWGDDDTRKPLTVIGLRVYRLPGLPAAIEAYRTLGAALDWARSSDEGLVSSEGLPLITWFRARIHTIGSGWHSTSYIEFPGPLERGWYLVVRPRSGRDQQFILQVTDVATYVTTTTTRSVLWVNDVTSGEPIAGARLWTAAGKAIATTGPDGTATPTIPDGDLFLVTAPDAGTPGATTVAGRAAIVPLHVGSDRADWWCGYSNDDYWKILATDRRLYRPTDEVDAWGMIRLRDGGVVPADVELRIAILSYDCDTTPAEAAAMAIARVKVSPGARTGTFATPIAIRDLPAGWYLVELWAGEERVSYRDIEVGEIRKPSYTIDVSTDRHVLVEGDTFAATVTSAFFDGTPVPGLPIRLDGPDVGSRRDVSSAEGTATVRLVASWDGSYRGGSEWRDLSVASVLPEETEIPNESTEYVVFPSRLLVDGTAEIDGGTVRIAGDAHVLDQAGAERQWVASAGTKLEAEGAPAAGARVHVHVVEAWYVPVRTGRGYDFTSKRAYDTYRYDRKERVIADRDVTAGPDGTFSLEVARAMGGVAAPKGHEYAVTLSGRDGEGREVIASTWAYAPWSDAGYRRNEELVPALGFGDWPDASSSGSGSFAIGAEMRLPLTWGGGEPPTGDQNRYLFLTATRGLRDVIVSASPVFAHRFSEHDIPTASIEAVWFTGDHYVVPLWGGAQATFDSAARELTVTLTPDAARHAPGDAARLAVRTTDGDGRPVAATVILRAIDEKLYAIDAAHGESPLQDLYAWVPSGVLSAYASHPTPMPSTCCDTMGGGQGGDAGGPGGLPRLRERFRDSVLFERVTTDAAGRASVSFTLSDDITSWRISGAAMTADFRAGQSSISLPVGLPFFIEAPLAPEYLVSDRPTLLVRAYGTALMSGTPVTFTVSAPTLGMATTTVRASAFTPVAVALPPLKPGDHAITIRASATSAAGTVRDALVRTIRVVESRFTEARSSYVVLPSALPPVTGAGRTTYVFVDAGRGRYLWPVRELAWGGGDRVDQALAALIARDVLKESFGVEEDPSSGYPSYLDHYQKAPTTAPNGIDAGEGIALLAYGSPEVALSARVSLLAGERFDWHQLAEYFRAIRADPASTREQRNLALAGLAGLVPRTGADYVSEPASLVVAALADPSLTVRERLYLALAAATLGDHPTAVATERSLLEAYGERLGPWVRLHVGSTETDILEATSLLALIAVTVGDPVADAAEAYVEEHFTSEDLYDLQKAAFLRAAVERAPAAAARFSYTLAGKSHTVDLDPGESYTLRLTPAQRATLTARTLRGRVGVTIGWEEPVDPASVAVDASLSLTRTIIPASPVPAGSVVTVVLTPKLGQFTMTGCYRVVDLVPSGLLPLTWAWGGTHGSEDVTPWAISGQRVVFCTWPWSTRPPRLVYYARVVTPGTYTWEPAVMQATRAAESAALAAADTLVIR